MIGYKKLKIYIKASFFMNFSNKYKKVTEVMIFYDFEPLFCDRV